MPQPRLLDLMRDELRSRHYSERTEKAYCLWVRRFVQFHMMGAVLALILELGASQAVGLAVNWAAFALMVGSYSTALVLILKALTRSTSVPFAVWPALAVFPLAWGLLVTSSPGGPYQNTPVIVAGVGAVVAWLTVGLRARRDHSSMGETSPG